MIRHIKKVGLNRLQKIFKKTNLIPTNQALAAEMTENFGKRLGPLGVSVRELTGDMQLTKSEMKSTQVCASITLCCKCGPDQRDLR